MAAFAVGGEHKQCGRQCLAERQRWRAIDGIDREQTTKTLEWKIAGRREKSSYNHSKKLVPAGDHNDA
jgi:hypothetical protein